MWLCNFFNSYFPTIAISVLIMKSKLYKNVRIFKSITLPKFETFKEVFKLGIPIGFGIFIELSMFSGAALIISALGVGVIASHTIAINITSVFFMLPLASVSYTHLTLPTILPV